MDPAARDEPTVGEVGEFGLIELIRKDLTTSKFVLIGPGDDATHVSTTDGKFVVSTDLLVVRPPPATCRTSTRWAVSPRP